MVSPSAGGARLARALLWAVLVVALATGAHVLASGHSPPLVLVAGLTVLLLPVASAVTRTQVRWPAGLALAGVGQFLLHHAFQVLGDAGCTTGPAVAGATTASAHLGHGAPGAPALVAADVAASCSAHGVGVGWGMSMIAGHAVATVATVGLLVGVERGIWWFAGWLFRPVLVVPSRVPVLVRQVVPGVLFVPRSLPGSTAHPTRGPPSVLLTGTAG
ncbi:hypothetical protein L1785_11935 [Antribacter sp. KLBMP9083]|uniref:Uncharacterized protein n=1 Tax=Antribacter soli TaxID=2910976 RepID=A0AA41QGD2_9MICO|nr:hypothetical protein [Antribacter soli]MCF4121692.1 hypothetical protein [Antribacter soli]